MDKGISRPFTWGEMGLSHKNARNIYIPGDSMFTQDTIPSTYQTENAPHRQSHTSGCGAETVLLSCLLPDNGPTLQNSSAAFHTKRLFCFCPMFLSAVLPCFFKTKYIKWKLVFKQKLHIDAYLTAFLINFLSRSTKMSFNIWMDKQRYICMVEHLAV